MLDIPSSQAELPTGPGFPSKRSPWRERWRERWRDRESHTRSIRSKYAANFVYSRLFAGSDSQLASVTILSAPMPHHLLWFYPKQSSGPASISRYIPCFPHQRWETAVHEIPWAAQQTTMTTSSIACGWSCSLFFLSHPEAYQKAVDDGRLHFE